MYIFDPEINIRDIIVVGLGGTGSALARHVVRMLYDMREKDLAVPQLTFVDPDVIEEKNIGRQMFTTAHVGMCKAELLATRFSMAFGADIQYHCETFNKDKHIEGAYRAMSTVILGCVDNHKARKEISKAGALWIDSGNRVDSGQVVIGNCRSLDSFSGYLRNAKEKVIRGLPDAGLLYPDLLKPDPDEPKDNRSCADLLLTGEQNILINDMMANISAQYLYKLLYRQPIRTFQTIVDTEFMSMKSYPITDTELATWLGVSELA